MLSLQRLKCDRVPRLSSFLPPSLSSLSSLSSLIVSVVVPVCPFILSSRLVVLRILSLHSTNYVVSIFHDTPATGLASLGQSCTYQQQQHIQNQTVQSHQHGWTTLRSVACLAVAIADPTNHGEMGGMGMGMGSSPPAATATITVGGMDMGMAGNSMMLIGYSKGGNAEWNKVNDPGMPAGKKHDVSIIHQRESLSSLDIPRSWLEARRTSTLPTPS